MKKILKLVVFFMIVVIGLQISVQADMGVPEIRPYKAKVINPNGTSGYDQNGNVVIKLKYGDEIDVQYETLWDDIESATFFTKIDGKQNMVDVNLNDIASVEEMYVSEELDIENSRSKVVVDEYGAILYKGPGYAYEKTGKILPKGTEIVVYAEKTASENPWFYTTYEGVSGWVCELECLGTYVKGEMILYGEMELFERTTGRDVPEKIGTIPDKTILKNVVKLDPWEQKYYFKYNDKWCTIDERCELFEKDEISIYKVPEEIKIYEHNLREFKGNKVVGTIPANTEFAVKYIEFYSGYSLVKVNGIQGWIYDVDYNYRLENVDETNLELPTFEDFTIIESPNIPFEEVKEREEKVVENVVIDENVEVENIVTENIVVNETEENDLKDDNQEIVNSSVNAEQIVAFGVVAAAVIALTCIVTIVLINKTSKKENK